MFILVLYLVSACVVMTLRELKKDLTSVEKQFAKYQAQVKFSNRSAGRKQVNLIA